jgi:hypothetical protein
MVAAYFLDSSALLKRYIPEVGTAFGYRLLLLGHWVILC